MRSRAAPLARAAVAAVCRIRPRLLLSILVLATALLVIGMAIIWMPLWLHYRVTPSTVEHETVEAHRQLPDDTVLEVVAEMSMTTDHAPRGEAATVIARRLLKGEFAWPNLPVIAIGADFAPRDLVSGVPVTHVFTASLMVPDVLLRAHEHVPDPAYVTSALRYFRGFVEYEQGVQFPLMYERNAHAVANRASVLARLWRHARRSPNYDAQTGQLVHLHAQRLAALLSEPSHFIAGTNHGVMQNIALLQLAAAFPALPDARVFIDLAIRRLAMQLPGYIAIDGAVLEHSAGYQFHGVVLSGYVARLLQLLNQPASDWSLAHERARAFLAALQRPDASLPQYGNTYRYAWSLPPVLGINADSWQRQLSERKSFFMIYPISGHAVAWDTGSAAGTSTHTLVPWSHFQGHGHQRAQELSLVVWAAGTDWSTNSGYWPGDDPSGALMSEGWAGGNGPHVMGEAAANPRSSTLLAHADVAGLRFLDLERTASAHGSRSNVLRVRRQIVQWQGSTWIALDTYADPQQRPLRVVWTAAPETVQRALGERSFRYEREGAPVGLTLGIDGSAGVTAVPLRGSRQPFGGWVAFDRRAAPAPSVDAGLASPTGWMAAVLELQAAPADGRQPAPLRASMTRYAGPTEWNMRLTRAGHLRPALELDRRGDVLSLREGDGRPRELAGIAGSSAVTRTVSLIRGDTIEDARRRIELQRHALMAAYPRFRTLEPVRLRYTRALAAAWTTSVALIGLLAYACHRRRTRLSAA